ncbi:hypothetical protein Scep_023663 [Stephania cephalantha]|uniref:Uncharacterized protein n=1 Tax=Stephania cephalantha TaxID=152367 RepID=A0AAP0F0I8_9MAGN
MPISVLERTHFCHNSLITLGVPVYLSLLGGTTATQPYVNAGITVVASGRGQRCRFRATASLSQEGVLTLCWRHALCIHVVNMPTVFSVLSRLPECAPISVSMDYCYYLFPHSLSMAEENLRAVDTVELCGQFDYIYNMSVLTLCWHRALYTHGVKPEHKEESQRFGSLDQSSLDQSFPYNPADSYISLSSAGTDEDDDVDDELTSTHHHVQINSTGQSINDLSLCIDPILVPNTQHPCDLSLYIDPILILDYSALVAPCLNTNHEACRIHIRPIGILSDLVKFVNYLAYYLMAGPPISVDPRETRQEETDRLRQVIEKEMLKVENIHSLFNSFDLRKELNQLHNNSKNNQTRKLNTYTWHRRRFHQHKRRQLMRITEYVGAYANRISRKIEGFGMKRKLLGETASIWELSPFVCGFLMEDMHLNILKIKQSENAIMELAKRVMTYSGRCEGSGVGKDSGVDGGERGQRR